MALVTHPPPVHGMPYDLLLEIFKLNANMFTDDEALNITRATSQVCRSWRNVMLATPSIWAKLIDLDCVRHLILNKWRNELIRRSATSLLWIKAKKLNDINPGHYLVNFLFDVVHKHWNRIQILVANVYGKDIHTIQYAPLFLPAPHLKVFDLNIGTALDTFTLFSRQAPMLRRFNSQWHQVDSNAPWLHQLHSIELLLEANTLSVLSATHNLQELKIRRGKEMPFPLSLPIVSLPNLSRLEICLGLKSVASILAHLEIPHSCSLDHLASTTLTTAFDCSPFVDKIRQAAQHYFQSYPPTKLLFEFSKENFILKDGTCPENFSLTIRFYRQYFQLSHSVQILPKLQTVAEFSRVTELAFHAIYSPPLDFLSFINCFTAVQTISASEQDLEFLAIIMNSDHPQYIQEGCRNIFPGLSTAIIIAAPGQQPYSIGELTLSVLDLTHAVSIEQATLDSLRDITDLEVLLNPDNVDLISAS